MFLYLYHSGKILWIKKRGKINVFHSQYNYYCSSQPSLEPRQKLLLIKLQRSKLKEIFFEDIVFRCWEQYLANQ